MCLYLSPISEPEVTEATVARKNSLRFVTEHRISLQCKSCVLMIKIDTRLVRVDPSILLRIAGVHVTAVKSPYLRHQFVNTVYFCINSYLVLLQQTN